MGIFLFVIFTAPVPTWESCCFIRVTSPSLYWVLVLVFNRSIEGKPLDELLVCGKCQRMSNVVDLWYLLVKSDCTECRQFVSLGRAFNALVSLIAARERLIDNHIQAILKNSLVRLHSTPYSSRVEGVGAKSIAL